MATELDYAYVAGLIDGDGSIGVYKHKASSCVQGYRYALTIRVSMTDKVAPVWLKTTFGGCLRTHKNMGWGKRIMYEWIVCGRVSLIILGRCLPYMKTKAEEAKVALEFQRGKESTRYNRQDRIAILQAEEILSNRLKELKRVTI